MPTETAVPVNYRQHQIKILDQDIWIGAMAAPDRRNANPDAAMAYVAEKAGAQKPIMIGLKEDNFSNLANRHGVDYIHLPIHDFTKASAQTYDKLFRLVQDATVHNRPVTIHCGAGNGRTGTAIASLKLREILLREAEINPSILDEPQQLNAQVIATMDRVDVPCTTYIKEAVESTRQIRTAPKEFQHNGAESVETQLDIQALIEYERFVKEALKKEFAFRHLSTNIDEIINNHDIEKLSAIQDIDDLVMLSNMLTNAQCTAFFKNFSDILPDLLSTSNDLAELLSHLNPDKCRAVSEGMLEILPQILDNNFEFNYFLFQLSPENCKTVCEGIQPLIPSFIQNIADFKNLIVQLTPEQFDAAFDTIVTRLPEIVSNANDLADILQSMNSTKGPDFSNRLLDELPKFINNTEDFRIMRDHLTPQQCSKLCLNMHDKLLQIISTSNDLQIVLSLLDNESFSAVCQGIKAQLPNMIKTADDFSKVLSSLPTENRTILYNAMKENLPTMLNSAKELNVVLRHLNPDECIELCMSMQSKLINILKKPADMTQLFENLLPEQVKSIHSAEIMGRLTQYIGRIESHTKDQKIDYGHGFNLLKDSRALHRKVNYLLAAYLLQGLQNKTFGLDIFEHISDVKNSILAQGLLTPEEQKHMNTLGKSSTELNDIISTAKSFNK